MDFILEWSVKGGICLNTIEVLFALIRTAICGEGLPDSIQSDLNPRKMNELWKIAEQQDIAHIISDVLDKNNLFSPEDAEIAEKFKQCQLLAIYRYTQQTYELERIENVLENEGIRFLPLKGAVIRKYYPEPYMRTGCDIDLLICKEDARRAIQILVDRFNYREKKSTTLHDYHLFSQSNVHLELHYTLIEDDYLPKASRMLQSVWDCTLPAPGCHYHMEMSNQMFMYYHIVHMAKHFLHGGCGIRPFLDLWLMQKKVRIDADQLRKMLEESSLSKFYDTATALSHVWLSGNRHNAVTKEMEQFVLKGGLYGTFANYAAVSANQGETKADAWLKIIFLPRRNLEVIYPNLKTKPYLYPFYQVKRWFRIFDRQKRGKVSNLAKARNTLSDARASRVGRLLQDLGLQDL